MGIASSISGNEAVCGISVDVSDFVPGPGDSLTVTCQAVDATGNGVPIADVRITLGLQGNGAAYARLGASSLRTFVDGSATTTLSISQAAPKNKRVAVVVSAWSLS